MGADNYVLSENEQLPEKVEESIKKIIKKTGQVRVGLAHRGFRTNQQEGYIDFKKETRAISTVGGNYFGALYEVDVKGKTEDGEKETNIFVKGIVSGEHLTVLSVDRMFNSELFFYNELAVVFDEIQNEAHVPAEERYNVTSNFQESIYEAIILENMSRKGYKTVYRMDPISLKFAELCVQQLGRLHALSFGLQKKRPIYFDQKIKTLVCPYNYNDELKALLKNSSKAISACLDNEARQRFNAYIPRMCENVQKYLFDMKYKRSLIHNDYRANNILMKEIDGEVTDVVPVDYQILYYGCPLIDFFYFIFLGTDQQFRKKHLEYLKDHYFASLTKMLTYFDIDVKTVFPREDFENLYNEVLDFGLHAFIHIMPFIFTVDDEIPELDKIDASDVIIKTDPRMEERARGIIDDFIQWGVL